MPRSTRKMSAAVIDKRAGIMEKLKRDSNIFVLGDLLIDHTAFVHGMAPSYPQPVTGEMAFRVKRRLDTAGGAATTARTINSLTDGTTFLWGLVGSSPWGTFRSILESSQALDGSKNRIEFRGVHDETDAPMTTISRLVAVRDSDSGRERYERKARFADFGHLHISTDRQISSIRHHLDRVHRTKAPLDCIVLNDLDMGALHHEVINEVAQYGLQHHIPIVVRARRDASKYAEIYANALICTLAEWSLLVDAKEEINYWDQNIAKSDVADEFARRSLSCFRNTRRFVILVGSDWIDKLIVIQRPSTSSEACQLAIEPGLPKKEKGKSQQVGASDVFAGALALALSGPAGSGLDFESALDVARAVTQAYQNARWNHVPHLDTLLGELLETTSGNGKITSRFFGTPFLPNDGTIDMARAKTSIPNIYTVTPEMSKALNTILECVQNDDKSLVLVASGGSGKTEIAKQVLLTASKSGLGAFWFSDLNIEWSWSNPEKTIAGVAAACKARSQQLPFVIVDEALKLKGGKYVATKGVVLLNKAQEEGIRFLFIDADFAKLDRESLRSQFARRVSWHQLSSAWDRPLDIPYVLAACLHAATTTRDVQFSIEASALVAIIEWMLEKKQSYGHLFTLAKDVVAKQKNSERISLRWADLPEEVRGTYEPHRTSNVPIYVPKFD